MAGPWLKVLKIFNRGGAKAWECFGLWPRFKGFTASGPTRTATAFDPLGAAGRFQLPRLLFDRHNDHAMQSSGSWAEPGFLPDERRQAKVGMDGANARFIAPEAAWLQRHLIVYNVWVKNGGNPFHRPLGTINSELDIHEFDLRKVGGIMMHNGRGKEYDWAHMTQ